MSQLIVLCIGGDPELLRTRAAVVESAGVIAITACKESAVREAVEGYTFAALIVGRSFTVEQQDDFIRIVQEAQGPIPVIRLKELLMDPNTLVQFINSVRAQRDSSTCASFENDACDSY